jgi:hypothetical protein
MSKTWVLAYRCAAGHLERAACHYKEAAKCEEAGDHEKATHHAYLAHGYTQHAIHDDAEAAKLHAEHFLHVEYCHSSVTVASEQGARVAPMQAKHKSEES